MFAALSREPDKFSTFGTGLTDQRERKVTRVTNLVTKVSFVRQTLSGFRAKPVEPGIVPKEAERTTAGPVKPDQRNWTSRTSRTSRTEHTEQAKQNWTNRTGPVKMVWFSLAVPI